MQHAIMIIMARIIIMANMLQEFIWRSSILGKQQTNQLNNLWKSFTSVLRMKRELSLFYNMKQVNHVNLPAKEIKCRY